MDTEKNCEIPKKNVSVVMKETTSDSLSTCPFTFT